MEEEGIGGEKEVEGGNEGPMKSVKPMALKVAIPTLGTRVVATGKAHG